MLLFVRNIRFKLRKLVLEMAITLVIVGSLILFDLLAHAYGVDSRDGADWFTPRSL